MNQKRSPLWLYFEVSVTDIKTAICKICGKKESRGSSIPKNMTTHCLKKHLEKEHPKENAIVTNKQKNNNISMSHGSNAGSGTGENAYAGPSTSSMNNGSAIESLTSLRSKQERKEYFQQTIKGWQESHTKLALNSPKAQILHRSIFEMIILDDHPFTIVNDRGFLRHHQKTSPNFVVSYHFHTMEELELLHCNLTKNSTFFRLQPTSTIGDFWNQHSRVSREN